MFFKVIPFWGLTLLIDYDAYMLGYIYSTWSRNQIKAEYEDFRITIDRYNRSLIHQR